MTHEEVFMALTTGAPLSMPLLHLAVDARCPEGWGVAHHTKISRKFSWDPTHIQLVTLPANGTTLQEVMANSLSSHQPANAVLHDFLTDFPECIPETWRQWAILFPATHFVNAAGRLFIRHLHFDARWHTAFLMIEHRAHSEWRYVTIVG